VDHEYVCIDNERDSIEFAGKQAASSGKRRTDAAARMRGVTTH
jgi:hypothetical protein